MAHLCTACGMFRNLDGSCMVEHSQAIAPIVCFDMGARLCTAKELVEGASIASDCDSNDRYRYSPSVCPQYTNSFAHMLATHDRFYWSSTLCDNVTSSSWGTLAVLGSGKAEHCIGYHKAQKLRVRCAV